MAMQQEARPDRSALMDSTTVETPELAQLRARYEGLTGVALLRATIEEEFAGRIAVVSSFGSESVVLLHMIAEIDPTVPVIFLNTGKLFGETLRYRDRLQQKLGLTDVRAIGPHPADEKELDPDGTLWNTNPDACCHFRKVLPVERALAGFEASITGRKRFQTLNRAALPTIEQELVLDREGAPGKGTRIKINPLIHWDQEDIERYITEHRLPRHPLVKDGYLSIGCMPCTDRVKEGEDYRSGRWKGRDKDECGIHGRPTLDEGGGI